MLARKRGGVTPIESHPISAIWVRYRGVKDMDGPEVAGTDPADPFARAVLASRRLATNHFTGWGYWIWFIPLKDGETSVGLVWDKRLVQPEGDDAAREAARASSTATRSTRELLEHATPIEGDCRSYGHLPYFVDRFIGPGWTCVGDAGGFLDPFYSPGLDQMAFSVYTRVELMLKALSGAAAGGDGEGVRGAQPRYTRFFDYFYESIYQDKYYVMGDYDTMTTAFLLDTGLYYAAAIMPVYRWSHDRLGFPPFYQDGAEIGYYPIRFYNRRLTAIAKRKKALGIYGNHNAGRRPGFVGYSVRSSLFVMIAHGLLRWWKAELANAWTYVVRPRPIAASAPAASSPAAAASASASDPSRRRPQRELEFMTRAADGARDRRVERHRTGARRPARGRRTRSRRSSRATQVAPRDPRPRAARSARRTEHGRRPRSLRARRTGPGPRGGPALRDRLDVLVNNAGIGVYGILRRDGPRPRARDDPRQRRSP